MRRTAILLGLAGMLSACGLHPLYEGGAAGPVATALNRVQIDPIEGKAGWLVTNALRDRLQPSGDAPLYRITVKLDDDLTALGIRRDDTVTRERRTLRARYQLVDAAKGTVLVDATAGSDIGVDVVGSDYATIAAEGTALERLAPIIADQIVARLGRYVRSETQSATASVPAKP